MYRHVHVDSLFIYSKMKLYWSNTGLLKAINGHKWRYSDFDRMLSHEITPSMYHFMAAYVKRHMNPGSFVNGTYFSDGIEARAIDAYYELSYEERTELHEQELVNLRARAEHAYNKMGAAVEAKLAFKYENPVFFPICDDILPTLLKHEKRYEKEYNKALYYEYIEQQWSAVNRD